jgi:hypothetical protein
MTIAASAIATIAPRMIQVMMPFLLLFLGIYEYP